MWRHTLRSSGRAPLVVVSPRGPFSPSPIRFYPALASSFCASPPFYPTLLPSVGDTYRRGYGGVISGLSVLSVFAYAQAGTHVTGAPNPVDDDLGLESSDELSSDIVNRLEDANEEDGPAHVQERSAHTENDTPMNSAAEDAQMPPVAASGRHKKTPEEAMLIYFVKNESAQYLSSLNDDLDGRAIVLSSDAFEKFLDKASWPPNAVATAILVNKRTGREEFYAFPKKVDATNVNLVEWADLIREGMLPSENTIQKLRRVFGASGSAHYESLAASLQYVPGLLKTIENSGNTHSDADTIASLQQSQSLLPHIKFDVNNSLRNLVAVLTILSGGSGEDLHHYLTRAYASEYLESFGDFRLVVDELHKSYEKALATLEPGSSLHARMSEEVSSSAGMFANLYETMALLQNLDREFPARQKELELDAKEWQERVERAVLGDDAPFFDQTASADDLMSAVEKASQGADGQQNPVVVLYGLELCHHCAGALPVIAKLRQEFPQVRVIKSHVAVMNIEAGPRLSIYGLDPVEADKWPKTTNLRLREFQAELDRWIATKKQEQ